MLINHTQEGERNFRVFQLRTSGSRHNRRSRRLEVVRLEVALEVQNLELILLRKSKKGAERGISLDNLLLHQLVLTGVGTDTRRDLRAAQLRTLREAKELAENMMNRRSSKKKGLFSFFK